MKTTLKLLICVTAIALIASCGKTPYQILQQKEGTWTATSVISVTGFDPITSIFQVTFYVGSATTVDTAGNIGGFNWSYDKKAEKITLTNVVGNNVYNRIYKVTSSEQDAEKWTFESQNRNDTLVSIDNYTETISLVRR